MLLIKIEKKDLPNFRIGKNEIKGIPYMVKTSNLESFKECVDLLEYLTVYYHENGNMFGVLYEMTATRERLVEGTATITEFLSATDLIKLYSDSDTCTDTDSCLWDIYFKANVTGNLDLADFVCFKDDNPERALNTIVRVLIDVAHWCNSYHLGKIKEHIALQDFSSKYTDNLYLVIKNICTSLILSNSFKQAEILYNGFYGDNGKSYNLNDKNEICKLHNLMGNILKGV